MSSEARALSDTRPPGPPPEEYHEAVVRATLDLLAEAFHDRLVCYPKRISKRTAEYEDAPQVPPQLVGTVLSRIARGLDDAPFEARLWDPEVRRSPWEVWL
jgi:hypothetical protein